jgi:hypothetical protein
LHRPKKFKYDGSIKELEGIAYPHWKILQDKTSAFHGGNRNFYPSLGRNQNVFRSRRPFHLLVSRSKMKNDLNYNFGIVKGPKGIESVAIDADTP